MEASVSAKKEVTNLYQMRLAESLKFVRDEATYEEVRKIIKNYLWDKMQIGIAEFEDNNGISADTYRQRVDAQNNA